MTPKIMIISGEASGDLHGGKLIKALHELAPDLEIFGVGGDDMKKAGMELYYHVNDLAYVGFVEVLRHYPFFRRVFHHLLQVVRERRPDLVVLIDYPGFNLRFAKQVKRLGQDVFYFIAPQVWAWGTGRAKKMSGFIDHLAVIFEFEVPFFEQAGVKASFVGHPLRDGMAIHSTREAFFEKYQLSLDRPLFAIFPGSRKQEIVSLLPVLLQAAEKLCHRHPDLQVAISQAPTIEMQFFQKVCASHPSFKVVRDTRYELMKYATAAAVASGTATLEVAYWQTPLVIVYKVSAFSYWLAKRLIKIKHIGLANVVAGYQVASEIIQSDFNVDNVMHRMEPLLFDAGERKNAIAQLSAIPAKLGNPGASHRTAVLILEMLRRSV